MTKFTRKPKAQPAPAIDDFIASAGRAAEISNDPQPSNTIPNNSISNGLKPMDITSSTAMPSDPEAYPWQHPRVRDDVQKVYNLRLPEAYLLKLRFIAGNTPGSMQRFCLDALLPAIDAEIERLTRDRS
jgi:hypothetical protein